jgi:hypothetical protein
MFHKEHARALEKALAWQKMSKKRKAKYMDALKNLYGGTQRDRDVSVDLSETLQEKTEKA